MDNQEAVKKDAEQTATTESAPEEKKDVVSQPTEAEAPVESNQPDAKVSESVPYDRFHSVNSEKARLAEENAWLRSQNTPTEVDSPGLDPESEKAVRATARKEWDEMQRQLFVDKHKAELSNDPILAGTVRELIARENAQGRLADRESVLEQAKKMLDETRKPVAKEAQAKGFQEGQQKAILKNQSGAPGSTSYKEPQLDDSSLSAEELRKKFNVPRV